MDFKRIESTITKDEWNDIVWQYKNKTIYHTYEWLEFIEESQNLKKIIFEIKYDGKVVGYLPGFPIKKGPIKIFGSRFAGWMTPYMGPLMNDDFPQDVFFKEFKKLMKKEGFHYAELNNRFLDIEIARKEKYLIIEGITFNASIKETPEEIQASYKRATKKRVRQALKDENLLVEQTKDMDFVEQNYRMLNDVFTKSKMKPTYPKSRVEILLNKFLDSDYLWFTWVKLDDKVIASRIDLIYDYWLYSFNSSSDLDFLKYSPNELARYSIMCYAAERGANRYEMVGGGEYKANFGGVKMPVYTIVYDRYGLYKAKNIARKLVKFKNKLRFKINSFLKKK